MILNGIINMSNDIKKSLDSSSLLNFTKDYISLLKDLLADIDYSQLEKVVSIIEDSSKNNNTIFVAGNGGSSSTASTFVNDVGFDVFKRSSKKDKIRIVSLNDNIPSLTAISNDLSFNEIFKSQIEINFQKGDILIVFSGSGNSKNLINAVELIKERNLGKTIGFLGFDGGALSKICDYSFIVKSRKGLYGPIEDVHLVYNHIISLWLQSK
tara:strand:+ start:9850 stop:10482 length:633 start_codon:yes stop_codon:yes gene_type:complete